MASKQQIIQNFKNRLSKLNDKYSEHIVGIAQVDGALEDALGLYSTAKLAGLAQATVSITANDPFVPLPLDICADDPLNDNLILALNQNRNPGLPTPYYTNMNFGYATVYNYSYYPYVSNTHYKYQGGNLSNPILPSNFPSTRPKLSYKNINGINTPGILLPYVPAANVSYPITYRQKNQITDDILNLAFSGQPTASDSFIVDGATIQFIGVGTPTSTQVLIGNTLSATITNLSTTLDALGFVTINNGSNIDISNASGTVFSYSVSLSYITKVYTSGIDTVIQDDKWALYDLMKAKALQGLIAQNLLEDKKIAEVGTYCEQLIDKTLTRLRG